MKVRVKRQRRGGKPFWQTFAYEGEADCTVSHILDWLNTNDDLFDVNGEKCDRIVWEHSCDQGLCGACGMIIDGTPALACGTFLKNLTCKNDTLTLEPLSVFPVVQDLVVDRSILFENLRTMELWLDEPARRTPPALHDLRYDSARCLKCGLCLEACPNYAQGERFYGPAVVPEAFLTLCQGGKRSLSRATKVHFASACSKSGACEKVCPMHIAILDAYTET